MLLDFPLELAEAEFAKLEFFTLEASESFATEAIVNSWSRRAISSSDLTADLFQLVKIESVYLKLGLLVAEIVRSHASNIMSKLKPNVLTHLSIKLSSESTKSLFPMPSALLIE